MDEVVNADQTFNRAVMPMEGKVVSNDGSNKVSNILNTAASRTMGGAMGSGFLGSMNGVVGNPMNSPVVGPMNHNIINAMGTGRTSSLNSMSNILGRGNRNNKSASNNSGSNNSGTKMGPMKSSPSNDPSVLANNLVNTVVNTVVNTMSNGNHSVVNHSVGNHNVGNHSVGNHSVGNLGNSPMTNGSNNPPGKGPTPQPGTGQVVKKKVGRPKGTTSANKVIKKEEKVSTSSSGYPGVSWNKRMCAWLAFFYDGASRRSRTFHPKHFNMDKEKARLSAVEFMKSLENNGRKKSTKGKGSRSKAKQLNEEIIPGMMSNDMASSLNSRAPNGTSIPMHLMSLNRGFYMQNMNRNFNLPGMSSGDRSNISSTYNSLGNTSNLGGMQDPGGIYIHNGGAPAHAMFGGNMHMLGSVKSNANGGTGCSNGGNNGASNGSGSGNNMLYLNDLMFHSNVMQTGNPSGGVNVNFVDRNLSNNNAISELLKMEESLGLHNKDVETLMNALFRQNYNMNIGMANMDKHQYLNSSGKNSTTGRGGMKTSSSNSTNGVNSIGNSNPPNSNNATNSMNGNSSQGAHLYLSNRGLGDVFENGNESNNGISMANMVNLPNVGNLPNYYDYNFEPYRGNMPPHLIDMVHRLNNDMKEDGKSGGVSGGDNRSDEMNELNFLTTDNAAWINQLKQSQNNLCNNINSNPCDLCDSGSSSPEPNMGKKIDMGIRKKAANNILRMSNRKSEMVDSGATTAARHVNGDGSGSDNASGNGNGNNGSANFDMNSNSPCDCAPHLRNQKKHYCMYYNEANSNATNDDSYNFMAPWNGNKANSSNNRMNGLDSNNENAIDSTHHASKGASNNSTINMGNPNSVILSMSTNNNQINSLAQNATNLAGNIEMNPKQSSHSSSAFSGTPNIQDLQKKLHFQTQSGVSTSAPDLQNALQRAKQVNNFAQKGLTSSNNNGATNNNASGGNNIGGSNPVNVTSNETTAYKKRGPKDSRKSLLPPEAVAPSTAGSSHAMNTQSLQNGKKNEINLDFADQNSICSKLSSIINFEWLSSDAKTLPNRNNEDVFDNGDA